MLLRWVRFLEWNNFKALGDKLNLAVPPEPLYFVKTPLRRHGRTAESLARRTFDRTSALGGRVQRRGRRPGKHKLASIGGNTGNRLATR